MLGLSTLGIVHTLIGLVALGYGAAALYQDKVISVRTQVGRVYLLTTLVTALTSLGIFAHGGFGPPHALALMTLAALAVGTLAAVTSLFGRFGPYLQALSFTTTFLFHLIPGVTETSTRLPPSAPFFSSPDAPALKAIYGVLLVLLLITLTWQYRWLQARTRG